MLDMLKWLVAKFHLLPLFLFSTVQAEIPEKPYYTSIAYGIATIYSGATYHQSGDITIQQDFFARTSKPSATQLTGGFRFSDNYAVEAQYMISGLLDTAFFVGNEELFDFATLSAQSYGIYAMYQKGDKVFFRARLGLGQTFVNLSGGGVDANYTGFGVTYGFSLGYALGKLGGIEFNYMRYADAEADNNGCILFSDSANETCTKVNGQNRFVKVNEKIRNSAVTVGYYFEF